MGECSGVPAAAGQRKPPWRVWCQARAAAVPGDGTGTQPVRRPYDLRHAALSLWLASGAPPAEVAASAGHSVRVLLTIYAHGIPGCDQIASSPTRKCHLSGERSMDCPRDKSSPASEISELLEAGEALPTGSVDGPYNSNSAMETGALPPASSTTRRAPWIWAFTEKCMEPGMIHAPAKGSSRQTPPFFPSTL